MVSAILLAGGKVKKSWYDSISKVLYRFIYNETYLFGEYKPLRNFKGNIDGVIKLRPMMEYVLHSLDKAKTIAEVVIVGEKKRIEQKVGIINRMETPVKVVQQMGPFLENALLSYENSSATNHALFVPSDIPFIAPADIDYFVRECQSYQRDFDFLFAVVSRRTLKPTTKWFRKRPYFWMIDDNSRGKEGADKYGRKGFRIANLGFANPQGIRNLELINLAYSVRKLRNPTKIVTVIKFARREVRKYLQKKLTKKGMETKLGELLGTRFKLIEIKDASPALDIDAFEDISIGENLWRNRSKTKEKDEKGFFSHS